MIQPTVGRVIWYWPISAWSHRILEPSQPFKADVVCVLPNDTINVAGYDHFGVPFSDTSVQILDLAEGEPKPAFAFCSWMPYQKQVAAKEIPPVLHAAPPSA
jgi:hypothetical protein